MSTYSAIATPTPASAVAPATNDVTPTPTLPTATPVQVVMTQTAASAASPVSASTAPLVLISGDSTDTVKAEPYAQPFGLATPVFTKREIPTITVSDTEKVAILQLLQSHSIHSIVEVIAADAERVRFLIIIKIGHRRVLIDIERMALANVSLTNEPANAETMFGAKGKPYYLVNDESGTSSAYGEDALNIAGHVLGLQSVDGIEVLDQKGDLILVHYRPEAKMSEFGKVRGVVIDVKGKQAVASSYAYTPQVDVVNRLTRDENGGICLIDQDGTRHCYDEPMDLKQLEEFDPETTTHIYPEFSGRVVRVFLWNGRMWISTHRNLMASNFNFDGHNLEQIYYAAGGPTREQLFGADARYSAICHVFFVSHSTFANETRMIIQKPFLVELYRHQMYSDPRTTTADPDSFQNSIQHYWVNPETGEVDNNMVALEPRDNYERIRGLGLVMDKTGVVTPSRLLASRADLFLANGWHDGSMRSPVTLTVEEGATAQVARQLRVPIGTRVKHARTYMLEERQQPGEAIIIFTINRRTGRISDLIRVVPASARFRAQILGSSGAPLDIVRRFRLQAPIATGRPEVRPNRTAGGGRRVYKRTPISTIEDIRAMMETFIPLTPTPSAAVQVLFESSGAGRIDYLPEESNPEPTMFGSQENMLNTIWLNLVLAAPNRPVGGQRDALYILDKYLADVRMVGDYLKALAEQLPTAQASFDATVVTPARAKGIISAARKDALDKLEVLRTRQRVTNGLGNLPTLKSLVNRRIDDLLKSEDGTSMDRLIKEIGRSLPRALSAQTSSLSLASSHDSLHDEFNLLKARYAEAVAYRDNIYFNHYQPLFKHNEEIDRLYHAAEVGSEEETSLRTEGEANNLRLKEMVAIMKAAEADLFNMEQRMTAMSLPSSLGGTAPTSGSASPAPSSSGPASPSRRGRQTGIQPDLAAAVLAALPPTE